MQATRTAASVTRHALGAVLEAVLIVAIVVGLVFGFAIATGRLPVGAHATFAASRTYAPTLDVSMDVSRTLAATTDSSYVIHGCGYKGTYGNVTVVAQSPQSVAWTGRTPDGDGCISVDNFSTQGPGHYSMKAYQTIRNKAVLVASKDFDL